MSGDPTIVDVTLHVYHLGEFTSELMTVIATDVAAIRGIRMTDLWSEIERQTGRYRVKWLVYDRKQRLLLDSYLVRDDIELWLMPADGTVKEFKLVMTARMKRDAGAEMYTCPRCFRARYGMVDRMAALDAQTAPSTSPAAAAATATATTTPGATTTASTATPATTAATATPATTAATTIPAHYNNKYHEM